MTGPPLRLAVVIGSTRVGRRGGMVGRWFADVARRHPDLDVDVIDLADVPLPQHYPREKGAAIVTYRSRLDAADAFVIVTPEYNHGYPATLKQAIDLAGREWHAKPVGFVSYGGRTGGVLAVDQLRQVFAELHAMTIRDLVALQGVWDLFDADGELLRPDGPRAAAKKLLDQLVWWARALRDARDARPYAA